MTTIYEHETCASHIVAAEQWDGSTAIIISQGVGMYEDMIRHQLPQNECEKLGAVLCKDIIDNYKGHAADLKHREEDARLMVADLESVIHELRTNVRVSQPILRDCIVEHNDHTHQLCARIEYLEAVNKGHDDCKEAFFKLVDQRSELEATNRGLEQDIENLRISNALYRKRWSDHENESNPSESHGTEYDIRSRNFSRMVSGYHGMLSRNGKTITITLPFEDESVARNAEKYIVGAQRIGAKLRED